MAQTRSAATLPRRIWGWVEGTNSHRTSYWLILGPTIALSVIGIVMVLSASSVENINSSGSFSSLKSQGLFGVLGLALMVVLSKLRPEFFRKFSGIFLIGTIFLLILVFTPLGLEVNGNRNWIRFAGFSFQPAEAAKLALSVWGAHILALKARYTTAPWDLLKPLLPAIIIVVSLVLGGRDLGTVIVFLMIIGALLFLAGFSLKWLGIAAVAGFAMVAFATTQSDNRMHRVNAWLGQCDLVGDPCYQYDQGIFALASGGWWGVGLGQSRQKWSYLPEAENDFIFTILGEELGLLGSLLVLGLYVLLAVGLFRVAHRTTSMFIRITTGAILVWIMGQAFLNIAMVTGLLPVIGVPLPFISAGGSALLMTQLAIGVVLSFVRQERRDKMENAITEPAPEAEPVLVTPTTDVREPEPITEPTPVTPRPLPRPGRK